MFKDTFNAILSLHRRAMTITRPGSPDVVVNIFATPSNYFRNLEVTNAVTTPGREFVISKQVLDNVSFPTPKKGDYLTDVNLGTMTISEIREMHDLGGAIMGYRVRIS